MCIITYSKAHKPDREASSEQGVPVCLNVYDFA